MSKDEAVQFRVRDDGRIKRCGSRKRRSHEPRCSHFTMESAMTMLSLRPMKFHDEVLALALAYPGMEHTRTMALPMPGLLMLFSLEELRGISAGLPLMLLKPPPSTFKSPLSVL